MAGMVRVASAWTTSFRGTLRKSTSRPTGTIMAPPMPWMKREITKPSSEFAHAQESEPAMNTASAAEKMRLGAEAVRHPARNRDEDGKAHQVGRDRELQGDGVHADIAGDHRQRRRDHGRIRVLHEEGGGDDQGEEARRSHELWN